MRPKISVVVPIHNMPNGAFFLWRLVQSLMAQSFKDYELVITQEGKMAENTNAGIRKARGELVKILYMDDYLAHKDSLKIIVDNFSSDDKWLVTGCLHDKGDGLSGHPHIPEYTENISTGNNCIGSPSVLTFRREGCIYFDERLSWLLDCDLYKRLNEISPPKIVNDFNVVIGIGAHQTTHILSEQQKLDERDYLLNKI